MENQDPRCPEAKAAINSIKRQVSQLKSDINYNIEEIQRIQERNQQNELAIAGLEFILKKYEEVKKSF